MVEILLDPVAKPRMTRSDIWRHRKCVDKYYAFKDMLVTLCKLQDFVLPDKYRVEFYIKMPNSWSISHRRSMLNKPHQQRPDLDNLVKSVNDCLKVNDAVVWCIEASKVWWEEGKIVFHNIKEV